MRERLGGMLLLSLCLLTLFGCGDNPTQQPNEPSQAQAEASTSQPAQAQVAEAQILATDDLTITATGLDYTSNLFGTELGLLVENTSSQNIILQAEGVSVNGLMLEPLFSCDVAAGKKANTGLVLDPDKLRQAGITTIAQIEATFYTMDEAYNKLYTSEPVRIETDAAPLEQTFDDSGQLALERDGVKIVAKEPTADSLWGMEIPLYLENNSQRPLIIQTEDVSVNGFMVSPIFSCDILPGKRALKELTIFSQDLEDNNISAIQELEVSFQVFDGESWDTVLRTEPITLSWQ